jgi:ABC-type transporter Mla MlaB component
MTWRIERVSAQGRTVLRLSGRIQSEHLAELKTQINDPEPHLALDLEEVTLVDVGVVRFLLVCQESGIELLHCSPYIRQWMVRERRDRRA